MSEQDLIADPPSISAAELRRRLLASTPPPIAAPDPDIGTGASGIFHASPGRTRLLMPGANGPVAASSVPHAAEPAPIPEVNLRSSARFMPIDQSVGLGGSVLGTMPGVLPGAAPASTPDPTPSLPPGKSADDYKRVKQENRELRKLLDEMKQLLQEASENEQKFAAREADLVTQLAARQRQTDEVTTQLQSIEEQLATGALTAAPAVPKTKSELEEWEDDLEREAAKLNKAKRDLDDDRRQLQEDEQALEQQMRQMEVSMARERALMARQETELKRLGAEIQQELELMQRGDAGLREQLTKFQRRAADVLQGRLNQSQVGPPPGGKR
jgi:predicted  nucleic acid-binding Zn-ribbon protein